MRISFRLIVSLMVAVLLVAASFTYWQVGKERTRLLNNMESRSRLLAESLRESAQPLLQEESGQKLAQLMEKFSGMENLKGVAIYDMAGKALGRSRSLDGDFPGRPEISWDSLIKGEPMGRLEKGLGESCYLYSLPISLGARQYSLVLFLGVADFRKQLAGVWRDNFLRVAVQMFIIAVVTFLVIRWSVAGPIAQMADWMKKLRTGETPGMFKLPREDLFAPIAREVSTFAKHLDQAKSAAEEEAHLRQLSESLWTAEKLKDFIRNKLQGKPLIVVSNREPYMHNFQGRKIECIIPAGGLVAAIDPVLRATDGLWIAHGSGDADAETSDSKGRLRVPPEDPHYTLRRVALTKDEENGYYYGFANEGIWPLCHIAHNRPVFRSEDWAWYQKVNAKFAEVVLEEIKGLREPCVLVQDYHFALLPRYVKEKRPDARIGLFWHIPWPNPEAFGICPWQREILYGMLGADILGFHIQFHCNNFLDTVDRTLESRIDWERFAVEKTGHTTQVRRYPISVAFPAATEPYPALPDKASLLREAGVDSRFLAVGVDRLDYTKGILERFRAVERFLVKHPGFVGNFTLAQIGAPSRIHIPRYHDFMDEVEREADRINWVFKAKNWKPIIFLERHHNPQEIQPYYKAADICLVTSLHDGMNLVAKEFVAARTDGDGVLILSRFAGASKELREALLVNPYDVEQMADAINYALTMPAVERQERMGKMRETVRENNIFRWAGNLITDLTRVTLVGDGGPQP